MLITQALSFLLCLSAAQKAGGTGTGRKCNGRPRVRNEERKKLLKEKRLRERDTQKVINVSADKMLKQQSGFQQKQNLWNHRVTDVHEKGLLSNFGRLKEPLLCF